MEDFTQKLLQRTQARKEALALKRENFASVRSGGSVKPVQREPLSVKNENKTNQTKQTLQLKGPPKPTAVHLPSKRESCELTAAAKDLFSDKRKKVDSPAGGFRTPSKVINKTPKQSEVTGGSIQDRLARLQSQTQKAENDVLERQKQRQMQRQMEVKKEKEVKTRVSVHKKDADMEAKRLSASVGDKAALFESGTPISTSDIDRILGLMEADSPVVQRREPTQKREDPPKRDYQSDKRYVKAYANKDEINSVNVLRMGSSQSKENCEFKAPKNQLLASRYSQGVRSSVDIDSASEDITDVSLASYSASDEMSSEQFDSEQMDSVTDDDIDSYESDEDGYESESTCDESAFDIAGVLKEAEKAEKTEKTEKKRQLSKQNLLPDEQQEFHVLSPATPVAPPKPSRGHFHTRGEDDKDPVEDESLSNFEKMLRQKANQIKSPAMVGKLDNLDKDTNVKAYNNAQVNTERKANIVKVTEAGGISNKNNVDEMKAEPGRSDNQAVNDAVGQSSDGDYLGIDLPNLPMSSAFNTVREKPKSKKAARRSVSFSGNRSSPKVIFKSGYNEEASAKYNVRSNIKDVSHDTMNMSNHEKIQYYLEEAANHQSIVLQASQALNLSYGSLEDRRGCPEVVEGERLLLLATQKRSACLEEVQRLKQEKDPFSRARGTTDDGPVPPCKATVTISGINLPLNQDFMMALRSGRMDLGVFHFIVIVQHGPLQVDGTTAVSTYDQLNGNCLPFKKKISLKSLPHDFTVTVRVFGMHTKKGDTLVKGRRAGSTSKNKESPGIMKNMFSSLTPKRRANSEDSPGGSSPQKTIFRNSNFTLVGETKMNLATIGSGKHVLVKVPSNSPLEGFIQLKASCVPEFSAMATGFLTLFEDVGGYTALNRRWCVLQNNSISCWRYPGDENSKEPLTKIDFKWCINETVSLIPRDQCARPNTFEVVLKRPVIKDDKASLLASIDGKYITIKHWLSADDKEDRTSWLDTINKLLSDHRAWQVRTSTAKQEYAQSKNSLRMSNRRLRKIESVPV